VEQEYYEGHAEDHSQFVSLSTHVSTPYVSSNHAVRTREWTPLEPDVVDAKFYVRGIGLAQERTLKGGNEVVSLVDVTHGH
jgi:hypothetical protein